MQSLHECHPLLKVLSLSITVNGLEDLRRADSSESLSRIDRICSLVFVSRMRFHSLVAGVRLPLPIFHLSRLRFGISQSFEFALLAAISDFSCASLQFYIIFRTVYLFVFSLNMTFHYRLILFSFLYNLDIFSPALAQFPLPLKLHNLFH